MDKGTMGGLELGRYENEMWNNRGGIAVLTEGETGTGGESNSTDDGEGTEKQGVQGVKV